MTVEKILSEQKNLTYQEVKMLLRKKPKWECWENKSTLCWECKHATNKYGKCSWSKELKPVEGWTAEGYITTETCYNVSTEWYKVIECPLFEVG